MRALFEPLATYFTADELETSWPYVLLLGSTIRRNDVILGKGGAMVKAWSFRRVPESEKQGADALGCVMDEGEGQ